jgi:hypothetical protein
MGIQFSVEAQDIETGKAYTDGHIVFTVAKTRPFGDKGTIITTKQGKRIIAGNSVKVAPVN